MANRPTSRRKLAEVATTTPGSALPSFAPAVVVTPLPALSVTPAPRSKRTKATPPAPATAVASEAGSTSLALVPRPPQHAPVAVENRPSGEQMINLFDALDELLAQTDLLKQQPPPTVYAKFARGVTSAVTDLRHQVVSSLRYLGKLAVLVEDYDLWRYAGAPSVAQYWADRDWPLSEVQRAENLERHLGAASDAVGFDVDEHALELTPTKERMLTAAARKFDLDELEADPVKASAAREQLTQIATARESDLLALKRAEKGLKERVPIYIDLEIAYAGGKPYYKIVSGELTHLHLEAELEKRAYRVYRLAGEELTLDQLTLALERAAGTARSGKPSTPPRVPLRAVPSLPTTPVVDELDLDDDPTLDDDDDPFSLEPSR